MNFEVPEIGEGVQEGELIAWKIKVGDSIKMDAPLVEIMTDKATVEIPSPVSGVIKELKAAEGDRIKVGSVIAVIDESGAAKVAKPETKTEVKSEKSTTVSAKTETPKAAEKIQTPASMAATQNYNGNFQESFDASTVPSTPYVRALAAKAGVDLRNVKGSGPEVGGVARVLEEDVLRFFESQSTGYQTSSAKPTAPAVRSGDMQVVERNVTTTKMAAAPSKELPMQNFNFEEVVERKPVRGLRRVISQAMVRSKFTAPHFSYVDEFECSSLMALREEIKKSAEQYGIKFSYLPFIVKALVAALKEFPEVNSSLEEKDGNMEILYKKFYHIGIAVATENGLIVPVIKHADKKSLLQIANEIQTLSEKTRAGKATSEELKGSTFSITSMGNIGGLFATPIINYPEVAIMGVYKIQNKPVVKNGQIVVGNTMTLSLSCDHRIVDGATAGHFCNAVIDRLAHPSKLMLEMI